MVEPMTTSPLEPAPAAPAPVAPTAAPVTAAPTITGPAVTPPGDAAHAPPPASAAYPEDDKLGPVPGGSPPVIAGLEVRARVLAEIKDAVAAARAAANKAAADPATAVHEVRKALRRMRAVVDAVAPALTRDAHRNLRRALIQARRTLGPSRDHTVAQIALTELPPEHA